MYLKKMLSIILTALIIMSFVGCGKFSKVKKSSNGVRDVQISYWNSGLGTEYLDKMIKTFNNAQSKWNVYYNATASASATLSAFGMKDVDTVDLYMTVKSYDISNMEPLDNLLDTTAKGDKKSIGEKFHSPYLKLEKASDGHYYTLTRGGGGLSIVYNKKLFKKAGINEVPRTTDELVTACDKLVSAGFIPFTHFTNGGYWHFIDDAWQAQYDGFDYYMNNFYSCKDENGVSPSKSIFTKKDGRYQVLKVLEKLITPEYVMNGANSSDHVTVQTMFLNENIGMMVNGSWLSNEMKGAGKVENFGVMKTPVISGIKDKLTSVKGDTELRNLISCIDSVTDGKKEISEYQSGSAYKVNGKEVSAEDWNFVKAARNTVSVNYSGESCFIPKYSDAKEGAKKFLEFFYSDEGYKIYTDNLHINLPINLSEGKIDIAKWNSFESEMYDVVSKAEYCVSDYIMSKHPIFTSGGASAYAGYDFISRFCANNPSDRITAGVAWENIINIVEKSYDHNWLGNIK